MRRTHIVLLAALILLPGTGASAQEFAPVTGPCDFVFPRDHGPHPGHKTEWWYYTGALKGPSGERYGFQFTIFRSRIKPGEPENATGWRTNQILLGHAALTDVTRRKHRQHEAVSRAALDLAGWSTPGTPGTALPPAGTDETDSPAGKDGQVVRLFLRDWNLSIAPDAHRLEARAPDFSYDLALTPKKGPIAHGERGYSRKGVKPESASCYYSIPRMEVSGSIRLDGKAIPVTGDAWMDQEYSSAPLEAGISGWDWFSLRLSDGSDLMVFFLRAQNGGFGPATGGTLIAPDGKATRISASQLALSSTGSWTSPRSKARYPAGWKLSAPGIALAISPEVPDQEMNTPLSTGVNYWEGLVRATGTAGGKPVTGEGYVELTGYDKAFTARY
ncbi:MAG: lipocalin-like domain-containing protein [Acidobacteriota bacterium]